MQNEAIELSKVRNTSSTLVHREAMFAATMKALFNYSGVLELEYNV